MLTEIAQVSGGTRRNYSSTTPVAHHHGRSKSIRVNLGRAFFISRQIVLVVFAALAYFAVRGVTENDATLAHANADRLLTFERSLGIDIELAVQQLIDTSDVAISLANWVYIWGHWPVIVITLFVLAVFRRDEYLRLRTAMFLSGAVGLVIFATWAVSPPRLFAVEYIDTVTIHSLSYRLLQPPSLINKYAAVPSFHFGWNLLVGLTWIRSGHALWVRSLGVLMPLAMAFAVVATANHWILDVIIGGSIAAGAWMLEPALRRGLATVKSIVMNRTIVGNLVPLRVVHGERVATR